MNINKFTSINFYNNHDSIDNSENILMKVNSNNENNERVIIDRKEKIKIEDIIIKPYLEQKGFCKSLLPYFFSCTENDKDRFVYENGLEKINSRLDINDILARLNYVDFTKKFAFNPDQQNILDNIFTKEIPQHQFKEAIIEYDRLKNMSIGPQSKFDLFISDLLFSK